jgi:putative drug exporter of the RND superfamily
MILVPATMELLGDRNWWLPQWLDRLLPHVDVEGEPAIAVPAPAPTDGARVDQRPEAVPVP